MMTDFSFYVNHAKWEGRSHHSPVLKQASMSTSSSTESVRDRY